MKTIEDLNLSDRERQAIRLAVRTLRKSFPVEKVILFGSKARGDDDEESDIDLLILTSRPVTWSERKAMNNDLYDIQLDCDVVISTLIIDITEWSEGTFSVLPIRDEISEQGVVA